MSKLLEAVENFADVFAGDYGLLKKIAHGHSVNRGTIWEMPSREGEYELRLLEGTEEEVAGLLTASVVNVLCPDRRQAAQVARELNEAGAVWLSPAGGAAQPDDRRLEALADVIAITMGENTAVRLKLSNHTGVCGGVKHAMMNGGRPDFYDLMYRGIPKQDGYDGGWERDAMQGIANYLYDELVMSRGVNGNRIDRYQAHVGEGDIYLGMDEVRR